MEENALLGAVVRSLGSAWRALRLYPPSSPLPLQTAQAVSNAAEEYLSAEPSLRLVVQREGFVVRGIEQVFTAPGAPELADALGVHAVAELHLVAPPEPDEVLQFLGLAYLQPNELRERGGMQKALQAEGVTAIKTLAVSLSTTEQLMEIPEEEADKFLAELAADSERLATWLRAMLAYDDESLTEGLLELERAANDLPMFGRSLGEAFLEQETDGKDRLIECSVHLEPVKHILTEMFKNLTASDITAAIRGGAYGANMMSISWALTNLPMGERSEELARETEQHLLAADRTERDIAFLRRMTALRTAGKAEPALAEAQPLYGQVLNASKLREEHMQVVRREMAARARMDSREVDRLLKLVDLAEEFDLYSRTVLGLAVSVDHLFESRDPALAMRIVKEIARRAVEESKPWPDLDAALTAAMEHACSVRSMEALLAMFAEDEVAAEYAKELVTLGGEKAGRNLADAAMTSEHEGALRCAELVLGKRLAEMLALNAHKAESQHAAVLAEVLARDSGVKPLQALEQMVARPEDQMRRETARGLAAGGGKAFTMLMPRLLRDPVEDVALVAVRVTGRSGLEGSAEMLASRLGDLDLERELTMVREITAVLATAPSESAAAALKKIVGMRSFFRRSRYAEAKKLARDALEAREAKGVA